MSADAAREAVAARLSAGQVDRMARFVDLVVAENARQNLISPATIPDIWRRHVMDSLQLIDLVAHGPEGPWLDIGSGGGFPGMVLAIAGAVPMRLVEPRRKRAEFLEHCVVTLELEQVTVSACKVEQVTGTAAIITARAVASVEKLLRVASHCATTRTRWLLPRGTVDADTRSSLIRQQMVFHVEHSVTQPGSEILIVEGRLA